MNIVLNETEWAKDMIRNRMMGKKPFDTLRRIARYYLDKGCDRAEVRKLLETFVLQCEPVASLPKWSQIIEAAINKAVKTPALELKSIALTEPELERIENLNGKQVKRLAFTLICLAKYWDAFNKTNGHWVNNTESEIMRMANINTSIKRQSVMYRILSEEGMINFAKRVDNTRVQVTFIKAGYIKLRVGDFRNLGFQYMKLCGEPFFECQNCGLTTKYTNPKRGRKQLYCPECAVAVAIRQNVNSVMRLRGKMAKETSEETHDSNSSAANEEAS